MTSYKPGDVLLVTLPFTSSSRVQRRPALVIVDPGDDDLVVARITSQYRQTAHDVLLTDWRGAGLIVPSIVRLHKLATIAKSDAHRPLGRLQGADFQAVAAVIRRLFSEW